MTTQPPTIGGRMRPRKGVAAGIAAGLVGGAAAGMVIGIPGVSGAADTTVSSVQQTDDDAPETGERLRQALEELVDDGTISSDQADAVADHLVERAPDAGWHRHGPGGRHGRLGGPDSGRAISDALTELLDLDADVIRDELRAGSTLAELAEANGVSTEVLVDTLVADAVERLDAAVDDGRLDADRAAVLAEKLEERITRRVDGDLPSRDRSGD